MSMFLLKDNWDGDDSPIPNRGMKRKFDVSNSYFPPLADPNKYKRERVLDVADNVMIAGELYRIMEEPSNGIIKVCYNDPSKPHHLIEKHEDEVDSIIFADYEEY